MSSSRSLVKQSKVSSLSRLIGTCKKDCWFLPGIAMWLLVAVCLFSCCYMIVTCSTFELMYKTQPNPYLDEVFHIPQARKYCEGNFAEWDPKITTLPGLYILSVGLLKPVAWFLSNPLLCGSVYALRSINMVASMGLVYVVFCLQRQIHGLKDDLDIVRGLLTALNVCLFPVLYFFNFLYYTDVVSTFLVLFAYLLCLHERYVLSAVTGFIAVTVRQTNIVWVLFLVFITLAEILKENAYINKKKFTIPVVRSYKYLEILWMNSCQVALVNTSAGKVLAQNILRKLSGYAFVGAAFTGFVLWNGSIVVGDKQAHQASFHLAQVLYFSGFTLFFMLPIALPYAFTLHHTLRRRILPVAFCIFEVVLIIHFNTVAHPYLLADNRHYTFYIWRRIIAREWWTPYMVTPAYVIGCFLIGSVLKRTDFVFQIGFIFCLAANIVPQSLLEFRYFIIPYVLLRLQVVKLEIWQLLSETALYALVNAATILIFTLKTVTWSDMEEPQRILW